MRLTEDVTLKDKIAVSIERLRQFEPPEGYWLAFSGGKDSTVILDLAKKAGVKYEAHYNATNVDPPELVKYIKTCHPDVKIDLPPISMWRLIVKKRMPPTRIARYCCEVLKERGGDGRFVITGIRAAESRQRSKRKVVELCYTKTTKGKRILNPIIDWDDRDVWKYIKINNLPYCSLYDEGFRRLGCVMCPLAGRIKQLREAKRWPWIKDRYIKAFGDCVAKRIKDRMPTTWENGQDMYNWWVTKPLSKAEKKIAKTDTFIFS